MSANEKSSVEARGSLPAEQARELAELRATCRRQTHEIESLNDTIVILRAGANSLAIDNAIRRIDNERSHVRERGLGLALAAGDRRECLGRRADRPVGLRAADAPIPGFLTLGALPWAPATAGLAAAIRRPMIGRFQHRLGG